MNSSYFYEIRTLNSRNMTYEEQIKETVRQKYTDIALQDKEIASCCSSGSCTPEVYNMMSENYNHLDGYNPDADLGLGCGLPTQFAKIKKGDTVIDLGSGAGNDCFVARAETGEAGKVIGIDFTPEMIKKARINAEKKGFKNVQFRQGDIEKIPVTAATADVIVSNCVLNLVPNKKAVFKEIYRVLKPGGHFCISDVVLTGELPDKLKEAAEMYAGCVSGASKKNQYIVDIYSAGFLQVIIEKENRIVIPDEILSNYLETDELENFKKENPILSITVTGVKPSNDCNCNPGCC